MVQVDVAQSMLANTVLVQTSFHYVGRQRQQDLTALGVAVEGTDVIGADGTRTEAKRLAATRKLFAKGAFAELDAVRARWQTYSTFHTIRFPIDGVRAVSRDNYAALLDVLRETQQQWGAAAENFIANYETIKAEAREALGGRYREQDYPSSEEARNMLQFEYRVLRYTLPDEQLREIDEDMYRAECEQVRNDLTGVHQQAVAACREQFHALITHLVERLSPNEDGSRKRLYDSGLERFKDFLDGFRSVNAMLNDFDLEQYVQWAKSIVDGMTMDELRNDDELRQSIVETFSEAAGYTEQLVRSTHLWNIRVAPRRDEEEEDNE